MFRPSWFALESTRETKFWFDMANKLIIVDRILGHNAQHLIKRLHVCDQIAMKWEKSHSEVMVWVCARIAFAILRATNLCLRGSMVKWISEHSMDDGASLPHFP